MYARMMRVLILLSLIGIWVGIGCEQQPPDASSKTSDVPTQRPTPAASTQQSEVAKIAYEIAEGVGEVRDTDAQGTTAPLLVFEEFHTSRVGQLQIAVMLVRLHDRHGLKLIGLEGAIQSPDALDAAWFDTAGGEGAKEAREDVAIRMLAEGEVSSAEFMAMVFPDTKVRGLEKEKEYSHKLDSEGSPQVVYLLAIAEKLLKQSDVRKVNELIRDKKEEEALDYLLTADPWVKAQYEALKQPTVDLKVMAQRVRDIRDKARTLGVKVEPKVEADLEKSLRFFEVASQRSITMIDYLLTLMRAAQSTPIAMVCGAAHSEEIATRLRERNVVFALLRPNALNPTFASLSMEEFQRKNDLQWARTERGCLGALLNNQRKPPPVIGTSTSKSYASACLAAKLIAEAARDGKRVPDELREQLAALPEFRVDWDSFVTDGYDVVFRMWLRDTRGRDKEVWARVGTVDSREEAKTIEQKLLDRIALLDGSGQGPAWAPIRNASPTGDEEGPGDARRERDKEDKKLDPPVIIQRVSPRALAVFVESQSTANRVGRLSG